MRRREFLQTLAAATYTVALPAIPAVYPEPRAWVYRIHDIESLMLENAFGPALRGLATLEDRPDITLQWAFHYTPETVNMDTVSENLDTALRLRFEMALRGAHGAGSSG